MLPERQSIGIPLLLGGLLGLAAPAIPSATPLALEAAVTTALAANPGLAAIQARAEALTAIPAQLESPPDPQLTMALRNLPLDDLSPTREAMTQLQLGLSQQLPYPGKLALRGRIAAEEAEGAHYQLEERRLQLVQAVKGHWWHLFYLESAIAINMQNQMLLRQLATITETRYQVGQEQQEALLLAELELSLRLDQALQLTRQRESEVVQLNTLLGHPPQQPLSLPSEVEPPRSDLPSEENLQQQARSNRPLLKAEAQRVEAAQRRIDLARLEERPDFTLGAVVGLRQGNNPDGSRRSQFATLQLGMRLPLFTETRERRRIDQRTAEWKGSRYTLEDRRNQVAAEVSQALRDYRTHLRRLDLFSLQILPQARQTVEAMHAAYQAGTVDFLNLIRSQTRLYDLETDHAKAVSRAGQALARLESAVGREVTP